LCFFWWKDALIRTRAIQMRHNFAIERLGRPERFKPQRYTYFCIHCRWSFLVEGWKACALDESRQPLSEPENGERVATFAVGPCPAAPPEYVPLSGGICATTAQQKSIPLHFQPDNHGLFSLLLGALFKRSETVEHRPLVGNGCIDCTRRSWIRSYHPAGNR
jgi:hypothetical protein